jgi:Fur family ferric uptake transcriptional regulator
LLVVGIGHGIASGKYGLAGAMVRLASGRRQCTLCSPAANGNNSRMEQVEQVFRAFLRDKRLKYTKERMAILNAVQAFGRPFEAEELLLALRQRGAGASKSTVYRTLKHLSEARLVKQSFFGSSTQSHYDYVGGGDSHDHLLDLASGKITPFSNEEVVALRDRIAAEMGFTAVTHRFQIIARKRP